MLAPTATEVTTAATVLNNTAAEDLVTTITGSTRSCKSDTGSGTAATDCNNEMVSAFSPATAYAIVALSIAIAIVFATASGGPVRQRVRRALITHSSHGLNGYCGATRHLSDNAVLPNLSGEPSHSRLS